jgi:ABC-2 type transport system ATP-binding protein
MSAQGLGKRYGRNWALSDCTLNVPAGRVVGLVGPNGAGKTTLLNLAVGMLTPTSGTIEVLGGHPAAGSAQLANVGYVAQDAPTYAGLSVEDHLRLGARLNPGWDDALARHRIERLGLDLTQRAGSCRAASAPSSRSPWASPNAPSCSSSTSRSPASTRSPGASSCRT